MFCTNYHQYKATSNAFCSRWHMNSNVFLYNNELLRLIVMKNGTYNTYNIYLI